MPSYDVNGINSYSYSYSCIQLRKDMPGSVECCLIFSGVSVRSFCSRVLKPTAASICSASGGRMDGRRSVCAPLNKSRGKRTYFFSLPFAMTFAASGDLRFTKRIVQCLAVNGITLSKEPVGASKSTDNYNGNGTDTAALANDYTSGHMSYSFKHCISSIRV